jgi:3-hydroxyacyl-CoA dehydrogenase/enoyl-CoA hydratase/3-hydroxybutyryl-CoA epimerase
MASEAMKLTKNPDVATLSIEDGIAVVTIDAPGEKVNTLSTRLFEFFERTVKGLASEKGLKAVVILSGKPDGFVAGADIKELQKITSREEFLQLVRRAHKLFLEFEALPVPTVAGIHGAALGGGLELALACKYRIASDSKSTKLGLPEVQLGLIPGAGGTQRLPILVGLTTAMDMILTGKQLEAKKAKKIGLVDEVVHPADLARRARAAAKELAAGTLRIDRPGRGLGALLLEKTPARRIAFSKAMEQVIKKTGGHYPAPKRAIELLQRTATMTLEDGLEEEAKVFADLVLTPEAKALMSIFFMKNDVDKEKHVAAPPMPVKKIAVLGAGLMGAGIGQVLAQKGHQIRFKDRDLESLGRGYKYVYERFQEQVDRRKLTPVDRDLNMARVSGGVDYTGFARADVVIEAVFEDLELKKKVLAETEAAMPERGIFASNTSSLPITDIAKAAKRPQRVIGMHFFSPVHKMPLVEVIKTKQTDEESIATIVGLGRKMGKTVILVNDGPGFFTTRALGPYMNEAAYCMQEGASVDEIDAALTRFGFPVGPMTLLDEVGIDVGEKVGKIMNKAFGDRLKPPDAMHKIIEDGRKGRKNGKGFYLYDEKGKKGAVDTTVYGLVGWTHKPMASGDIADRCWMQLLNECAKCMEEGIITEPRDVDIGTIFGFGFPPFRGGVLHAADSIGISTVVRRLSEFEKKHGERFTPAKLLVDMDKAGKTFFP